MARCKYWLRLASDTIAQAEIGLSDHFVWLLDGLDFIERFSGSVRTKNFW